MKRQKFVGSDLATKFEAMTSTILYSEKSCILTLTIKQKYQVKLSNKRLTNNTSKILPFEVNQNFDQAKRDDTFLPMPIILKGSVCI